MIYISSSSSFIDKYIVVISLLFLGLVVYRLSFIDKFIQNDTEFDNLISLKNDIENQNDVLRQQIARVNSYDYIIATAINNNYLSNSLELNLEKFVSNNSIAFNE